METSTAVQEDRSKRMRCGIVTDANEDQGPEGIVELLVDLRQMVNNSAFSDVVFVCSDEKRVEASRILLAGRSEVLKNMLCNGMAETRLFEIELPEISSPALLSVLEFLYTGVLLDYHPQSWTAACELMLASRFFLLPKLEMIIRQFMHKQIFDVGGDWAKAASLLTEAIGFNGLCDNDDVFLMELVTILSSKFDPKSVESVSEDAFHYLLLNSKGNSQEDDNLSLREYIRFESVIRWWISNGNLGSYAVEILVEFLGAHDKTAPSLCNDLDNAENGENPLGDVTSLLNDWNFCQMDDTSKNSVVRLLSNIDFLRIHPVLLAHVVEPLKMISPTEILNSFRFHALRKPMFLSSKSEYVWDHGESFRTVENGHVIERAASKIGLAVTKRVLPRSNSVYEWSFTIEEVCEDVLELGFICSSCPLGVKRPQFDGKRLSNQDRAGVLKFRRSQTHVTFEGPAGTVNWKVYQTSLSKEITVVLKFQGSERGSEQTCSLSIKGHKFGVVWKNLPNRLCYPAISFGNSSKGRVRMN